VVRAKTNISLTKESLLESFKSNKMIGTVISKVGRLIIIKTKSDKPKLCKEGLNIFENKFFNHFYLSKKSL